MCFATEPILIARDSYERYIDDNLDPSDRIATSIPSGVEDAWDALTADREPAVLQTGEGTGAHPTGGWLVAIESVDLDDGRHVYVERRSGDVPDPCVFLIAATWEPSAVADKEL